MVYVADITLNVENKSYYSYKLNIYKYSCTRLQDKIEIYKKSFVVQHICFQLCFK